MTAMKIRTATSDDAAAVLAIYAPIVLTTTISFELEPPSAAEMRNRIVATLERFPWLVGEDEHGRVNAYAFAGSHRDPGAYQWSVNTTIYVREDARGHGVGKRLYSRLLELLSELGYYRAFAGIALPNAASVALHKSVGFRHLGVYRSVGFKFGAWRDVRWWQRQLREPALPEVPKRFNAQASG